VTTQTPAELGSLDITAIKFGQAMTATSLAIAFVLDQWPLAAAIGSLNLFGSLAPRLNVMPRLYALATPILKLRRRLIVDEPQPHRFAQGFSGTVTLAGSALVAFGATVIGWSLALLVSALAILNITVGFCAGCFTYLQLRRAGILGRAG
jgi:hypothetical protein